MTSNVFTVLSVLAMLGTGGLLLLGLGFAGWGFLLGHRLLIRRSLQATALGLVAHQMGGFDPVQAQARFAIPADHSCMAMIAVGHPGALETLPEALRDKEQAPRSRKPLAQFVFEGRWDAAFPAD